MARLRVISCLLALLALLSLGQVAAVTIRLPVAVIALEESTALPPEMFVPLPNLNYTASNPVDRPFFNGLLMAASRVSEVGGFVVGDKTFELDVAIFNRARFVGNESAFARAVVAHSHQPIIIFTMLAWSQALHEQILINLARECQRTSTCMVSTMSSNNNVHTCTQADALAPECVGRLGRRRFRSTFCPLPNSDYITESFLSYMYAKQQTKVAFFGADGTFTDGVFRRLPEIVRHFPNMKLVYSVMQPNATCTPARVNDIVQHFQDTQPDIIVGAGASSAPAQCWASIMYEMERRNYFPNAFNLMGGFGQGLITFFGVEEAKRMCRYMYTSVALDLDARGYSYFAKSSTTHTELFEASDNTTSGAVFRSMYSARFGPAAFASPYMLYSMLGALDVVTLGLLLEVSDGVLDAQLWQTTIGQINSPSLAGTLQFDENGQSLGLRLQLMNQFDYTDNGPLVSRLVSGGSDYHDTFPAPNWKERTYRSNLLPGDEMVPRWDLQYLILATAVLFFGCWSGMFRMQAVLKDVMQAYQKGVSWRRALMVLLAAISFADGGMWAFFVIAFQGLHFEPRDMAAIHATARPLLPLTALFASTLLALVLVPVMYVYSYVYKQVRRHVVRSIQTEAKKRYHATGEASTTTHTITTTASDNLTLEMFDADDVHGSDSVSANGGAPADGNIVIVSSRGLLRRCWRRANHVSLGAMARLAVVGMLWSICSVTMQLVLLQSLSQTVVVPHIDVGGCAGAIVLACALSALAFVSSGFFVSSDIVVAGLHVATSLLMHIITTLTASFEYSDTATLTGDQALSSDVVLLLGLLVGLVSTIVSILILLRKAGADNAHIQQENRQLVRAGDLARHALLERMRRARAEQQRHEAMRHFLRSQRVFMHLPAPDETTRIRYAQALKQLVQVCDPHVADATAGLTMDDANLFIHGLSSEKQRKRAKTHAQALHKPMVAADGTYVTDALLQDDLFAEWMDMSLRKNHCTENMLFLLSVDEYEKIDTDEARHDEAAFILQTFIIADAPLQVNLAADLVDEIAASVRYSTLHATPKTLFSAARGEVVRLFTNNNMDVLRKDITFRESFATMARLAQANDER